MDPTRDRRPVSPTPSFPQTIGERYIIERELGRGGSAIVYLARDQRYDRRVAVKVLNLEIAGAVATERFLREILITARLQHPHILAVLDSGLVDGVPFYVAPFLDGASLRSRLEQQRQLPLDEALLIVREVAEALDCAHEHGIIHRDIKPENVLFSMNHACVADFGIAYALDRAGAARLTSSGVVLGTPAYMSPEQLAGERLIDARSDIYSLGCLLYEMLAGVPPFSGATPGAILAQRFAVAPPPVSAHRAGLPERIEQALAHAMCVAPTDRVRSVREFTAELGVPLGAAVPLLLADLQATLPPRDSDTLTGLPKRRYFREQLENAIARCTECKERFAVLFLDLDHFKQINDTFGHAAGDAVLRTSAHRVKSVVGETTTLSRLGGDEFTILVPGIADPNEIVTLAAAIRDVVIQPVSFADREIAVSTSIGIALFPDDADTADALVNCADVALYAAKDRGRNSFVMHQSLLGQPRSSWNSLLGTPTVEMRVDGPV